MSKAEEDLLVAFERHSVEAIRGALDAGADPIAPLRGKSPVTSLVEMYTRSTRFPDCLRLLLERGSYAQMGLLPQMHRRERDVYAVIRLLLEAADREVPPLENVPNRYLLPKSAAPGA